MLGAEEGVVAPPEPEAEDRVEALPEWLFVIVFIDSDRVGRGEWSRVYDACMVVWWCVSIYLDCAHHACVV